jgi:Icc protein
MNSTELTRRQCLKWFGGAAAAVATSGWSSQLLAAAANPRKRLLRVAQITDVHVQPELRAAEGFAACLRHIQSQADKPSLILNSGDCVMDASKRDRARTDLQWQLWQSILKQENSLPIAHAVGNHDVWGWNKSKSKTTGSEARWGKQYALDEFGMDKPYRSFDQGGWHFIVLDSIQPFEDAFKPFLDAEQFAWLESDLARTDAKTPVLIMSHVPIFSVASFWSTGTDKGEQITLARHSMHFDYRKLKHLFKKHTNVKACISGHMHFIDSAEYMGVKYLCNGAVCGGWWQSHRENECHPGYAMLDLYDDGSVEREYVPYGWKLAATRASEEL